MNFGGIGIVDMLVLLYKQCTWCFFGFEAYAAFYGQAIDMLGRCMVVCSGSGSKCSKVWRPFSFCSTWFCCAGHT